LTHHELGAQRAASRRRPERRWPWRNLPADSAVRDDRLKAGLLEALPRHQTERRMLADILGRPARIIHGGKEQSSSPAAEELSLASFRVLR